MAAPRSSLAIALLVALALVAGARADCTGSPNPTLCNSCKAKADSTWANLCEACTNQLCADCLNPLLYPSISDHTRCLQAKNTMQVQCLNDADQAYEPYCTQCQSQLCADCLNFNSGFTRYFTGYYTYIGNKNKCPDVVSYLQADCMTRSWTNEGELLCFDIQSQLQADCIHWSYGYVLPGDVAYNPQMCKQVQAQSQLDSLRKCGMLSCPAPGSGIVTPPTGCAATPNPTLCNSCKAKAAPGTQSLCEACTNQLCADCLNPLLYPSISDRTRCLQAKNTMQVQCLNNADQAYEPYCVRCQSQLCADCLNFNSGFTRYFTGYYTYIANKNKCPDVVSYLQADCMTRAPSLDSELVCFDIQSQLQADCIHWSDYYVLPGDKSYNALLCKQVQAQNQLDALRKCAKLSCP